MECGGRRCAGVFALKESYRRILREGGAVRFVLLVPQEILNARLRGRPAHLMPPTFLASQLTTLQIAGDVVCVDGTGAVATVVERILGVID